MNLYHALNRGTDKRIICLDDRDRLRFVRALYVMNDSNPVENTSRSSNALFDLGGRTEPRDRLVTIHAWCLMGNHYHLLVSENTKSGISTFLMKLNVGYTKYFNEKYKRSGVLFQGKTKRVPIVSDRQYLYIMPYIHLNPLDFLKPASQWRSQCIANPKAGIAWIKKYKWCSYKNYAGETEFSQILEGSELFKNRSAHVKEVERYLYVLPDDGHANLNLE